MRNRYTDVEKLSYICETFYKKFELLIVSTFLLIHGGMQGGWCWKRLIPYLEYENHRVIAPCLSGLGTRSYLHSPKINLSTHISDIVNLIKQQCLEKIIIVGHSYGGMIATGVADQIPHALEKIIYLDAVLAKPEQSMSEAILEEVWLYLKNKATLEGEGWYVPAMTLQDYGFEKDEDIAFIEGKSTPQSLACFTELLSYNLANNKRIPRYYIYCKKSIFLRNMQCRAEELGINYQEIESGHFLMIEKPKHLANILNTLAHL